MPLLARVVRAPSKIVAFCATPLPIWGAWAATVRDLRATRGGPIRVVAHLFCLPIARYGAWRSRAPPSVGVSLITLLLSCLAWATAIRDFSATRGVPLLVVASLFCLPIARNGAWRRRAPPSVGVALITLVLSCGAWAATVRDLPATRGGPIRVVARVFCLPIANYGAWRSRAPPSVVVSLTTLLLSCGARAAAVRDLPATRGGPLLVIARLFCLPIASEGYKWWAF